MTKNIKNHHKLEARLKELRLEVNRILDEMEALWHSMTDEEREILEAERTHNIDD